MKKQLTLWVVARAILSAGALSAFAHGGTIGIVKERMDAMVVMGDAVKSYRICSLSQSRNKTNPSTSSLLGG